MTLGNSNGIERIQSTHVLVLCSCPEEVAARSIANTLIEQGLAACASILPGVESVYRWRGKVESSREWLLLVKTRIERYAELESLVRKLHPDELPEIICLPVATGLAGYLDWVSEEVGLGS